MDGTVMEFFRNQLTQADREKLAKSLLFSPRVTENIVRDKSGVELLNYLSGINFFADPDEMIVKLRRLGLHRVADNLSAYLADRP